LFLCYESDTEPHVYLLSFLVQFKTTCVECLVVWWKLCSEGIITHGCQRQWSKRVFSSSAIHEQRWSWFPWNWAKWRFSDDIYACFHRRFCYNWFLRVWVCCKWSITHFGSSQFRITTYVLAVTSHTSFCSSDIPPLLSMESCTTCISLSPRLPPNILCFCFL